MDVRTITEPDLPEWIRALRTGFLASPEVSEEDIAFRRATVDFRRTRGVFDDDRCVGTLRSFTQQLSLPGGASVTAGAVSNVTVSPTHRRRGLLGRMLGEDLREARDRGDVAATLIAAEYPIYGRYGFGPATWVTEWEVDVHRTGLDRRYSGPSCGGRVALVEGDAVRKHGPALHRRLAASRPGVVGRPERWWLQATGQLHHPARTWTRPFYALYLSPGGEPEGLVVYAADDRWDAKRPRNTLTVRDLIAVTPRAERALWHYLLTIDWVGTVRTGYRAPDDLLPDLLPDPRAARVTTHADYLWVRPLDVPRLLAARTYATTGTLVLAVTDPAGPAAGRFLLDAGPDGAHCAPTNREADLTLPVGELGALCLGDGSAVRLAALGRITEERPGAAARAELLLRTARRPWCPDEF
ncbi:GNAT family N-acetyltransferase [Streptomyces orinoci]|uniref:GNAT family N-acetyltransferase n=1 Tax=Streptomyces orinoci TaxID=67339 RepID=A0ABV3JTV1_STRON|nr:GNAT family N-acetyltransferase [Streptomyces orinoci]